MLGFVPQPNLRAEKIAVFPASPNEPPSLRRIGKRVFSPLQGDYSMTNERIAELDKLATGLIDECRNFGQSDNPVIGFWKGGKMVVDELKIDINTPQTGDNYHD